MTAQLTPAPPAVAGGLRSRLLLGMGANLLGQVISMASRLLLVPMFLAAWGVTSYGEWLLLSSFVSYLALADLGAQTYIVNRLTQAHAREDWDEFRTLLHTGLALIAAIAAVVFCCFGGVILLVPLEPLLQITATPHAVVLGVLVLLALQLMLSLVLGIVLGVYRAIGELPRGVMLNNCNLLLQLVLSAAGLWLHAGMAWIAAAQLLPNLLVLLWALGEINYRFPQFRILHLGNARLSQGLAFAGPSFHFLAIQVSQALTIQGTVQIVGVLLSPVHVVMFSTLRTIVNVMRQFLGLVGHSAWPDMTRLHATGEHDRLLQLFRFVLRSTLAATALGAVLLHTWGAALYGFWLKGHVPYQQPLMDLFLLYMVQLIFWASCSFLLMAANLHRHLSYIVLVSSGLALALAYAGGRHFGLTGLVGGLVVSDLLLPFWAVPLLLRHYIPQFDLGFYAQELLPVAGCLTLVYALPWVMPPALLLLAVWWLRGVPSGALRLGRWRPPAWLHGR